MKKSEIIFGALRLPVDYASVIAAFILAYYLRPITDLIPGVQFSFGPELLPPQSEYVQLSFWAAAFLVFIFAINHLYSLKATHLLRKRFSKIIFLVTAWMMFIISYYFLIVHELFFSRIALGHIWFFSIIFIFIGRLLVQTLQYYLLRFGVGKRKVLFIGADQVANRFYAQIKNDRSYEIIGALDHQIVSTKKNKLKIVGTLESLESIVSKYEVEEIIQAEQKLSDQQIKELHAFCRNNQIRFHFIPDLIKLQRSNVEIEMYDNIPLVSLKDSSLDGWGHIYKRLFDLIVSMALIIVLIPLWIIISLLIRLDSKGPVFYGSKRKYRSKIFSVYKFRSMVANADHLKNRLIDKNERSGPMFKIKDDPRITKLGRFLRKTSIDELPQLFNVLLGNMSLVGPRPHLPEEIEKYEKHHHQVFAIKPGITGLAQISGRSNLDFEEEVKLDVYYIENWSIWFDIKIMLRSVFVIIQANGD